MADNQSNYGLEDDEAPNGRRLKPRKGRKRFGIEARWEVSSPIAKRVGLDKWWMHSKYLTEARRNQAMRMLRERALRDTWGRMEYRKAQ